ncbi:MAG TPA: stage II sporulation protein M, partial [Gemmatimonadaceae bacterium]
MPDTRAPLGQTVDVETPELVVLNYTIAGVGSRTYAALIDYLIVVVALLVIDIGVLTLVPKAGSAIGNSSSAWSIALIVIVQFAVLWGYYVVFEALNDGQTPGKRSQRLRVVRDGGYSITFGASAVRNIVRFVDMQPIAFYAVGLFGVIVSKQGKRLGDMVAGTLVVKEDLVQQPKPANTDADAAAPQPAPGMAPALHTLLSDAEFELLEQFIQRQHTLDEEHRNALAARLVERLSTALTDFGDGPHSQRLARLARSEREARARGLAHRNDTGAARERHVIIATSSQRWATFAASLATAQKGGLSKLGEDGVHEFVREYRDLTADLARLRTAARGREATEVFYLNRLASSAHNLLYRRKSVSPADLVSFLFVDVPREIRASAVPVLLAALLLFGPAAIAYTAVVTHPEVTSQLVPASMLDRAEDGVRRAKNGDGYIPDPQIFRPVMASTIIANNVQVAIAAFALGMTGGVFTLLILVMNGVSLGAVSGLYASKGIGTLLLAFVAPHGVLELTAICISGGAGFLLAAALILP